MTTATPLPRRTDPGDEVDVVVVGAGLAGLAAAATAARAGARTLVLEARTAPGGRARSDRAPDGTILNHGAHALYLGGSGRPVLRELGVRPRGRLPRQRGAGWLVDGTRTPLRHLSVAGGTDAARAGRALLSRRAAEGAGGCSLAAWMDDHVPDRARPVAELLVRTATYSADHDHLDAAAGLAQLRRAARGVLYLHGGWAALVAGLRAAAVGAGASIRHERVLAVEVADGSVTVVGGSGRAVVARAVVLAAGGPGHADGLLAGRSPRVAGWAEAARPVRATTLDVALRRAPRPRRTATYALDEPLYLVDHAASARLGPDGAAALHGLWYEPGLTPGVDPRERLEAALDVAQPGWRPQVTALHHRRDLVVAHDRPQPGRDPADAPTVEVDDLPGVHVAGDWLTGHGLLADGALSSGRDAGAAAARAARPRAALTPAA